jgi:hypothetical protein
VQTKRLRVGFLVILAFLAACVAAFPASDTVRFVVCSIAKVFLYGNPSESNRQEAQSIADTITSAHPFSRGSVSQPDRPPVFWTPSSKGLLTQPAIFRIYDVRDRTEQDKVIDAVRTAEASARSKPVELQFLDHENWISRGNSSERGSETQLRRVRITSDGIRDDGREQLVKYPSP